MRNIPKILIIFLIISPNFTKSEESMFMSDDESKKILSMLKENKKPMSDNLKLTGIVFIDEANWIVWINNKPYSSIGENGDFSIDEVSENEVIITKNDGKTITLTVE